jgi:MFS family permease
MATTDLQSNDLTSSNSSSTSDESSASSTENTPLIHGFKDQQSTILSPRRLLIVFFALALAQFTAFLDQTAISTALPAIASGLHTGSSISWVGASFLASSTSIHLVNGRLSDIFGRKACLVLALLIMGLGNLLSGFSWRALSGFGAGAIGSLVQISISDITTLKQRGNYFGLIGISVALGNGLGPLIGGLLTERFSWRWAFWFISPMTTVVIIILVISLPASPVTDSMYEKLKLVDWLGVFINMAAVLLILVSFFRRLSPQNRVS